MKLYSFFNSSASYRVRIALALKGLDYQTVGVNIRIGQQNELAYRRMNPVGLVPTLVTDEGESLGQSLAITEDRKSTRLNFSHLSLSRMPSSA